MFLLKNCFDIRGIKYFYWGPVIFYSLHMKSITGDISDIETVNLPELKCQFSPLTCAYSYTHSPTYTHKTSILRHNSAYSKRSQLKCTICSYYERLVNDCFLTVAHVLVTNNLCIFTNIWHGCATLTSGLLVHGTLKVKRIGK